MSTLGTPRDKSSLMSFDHGVWEVMLWGRHMHGSSEDANGWRGWNALRLPTSERQLNGERTPWNGKQKNYWHMLAVEMHSASSRPAALTDRVRVDVFSPRYVFLPPDQCCVPLRFFSSFSLKLVWMPLTTPLILMGLFGTITCSELRDQNARILPICFYRSFLSLPIFLRSLIDKVYF